MPFVFFRVFSRLFAAKSTRYQQPATRYLLVTPEPRSAQADPTSSFYLLPFSMSPVISVENLSKKFLITLEILIRKFKKAVKNALAV
jgi:hypothetical protein